MTRNVRDYQPAPVAVIQPVELLAVLLAVGHSESGKPREVPARI